MVTIGYFSFSCIRWYFHCFTVKQSEFSPTTRGKMTVAAMVCFAGDDYIPRSRISALNILFLIMLATPG